MVGTHSANAKCERDGGGPGPTNAKGMLELTGQGEPLAAGEGCDSRTRHLLNTTSR